MEVGRDSAMSSGSRGMLDRRRRLEGVGAWTEKDVVYRIREEAALGDKYPRQAVGGRQRWSWARARGVWWEGKGKDLGLGYF